jgi:hypothetical protein
VVPEVSTEKFLKNVKTFLNDHIPPTSPVKTAVTNILTEGMAHQEAAPFVDLTPDAVRKSKKKIGLEPKKCFVGLVRAFSSSHAFFYLKFSIGNSTRFESEENQRAEILSDAKCSLS